MAGEYCGPVCAWCGRCDAEPDHVCACGDADCLGDCASLTEPDGDQVTADVVEVVMS